MENGTIYLEKNIRKLKKRRKSNKQSVFERNIKLHTKNIDNFTRNTNYIGNILIRCKEIQWKT